MARIKGINQMTGSIKGVSMYTMRGSDEVFVRTKGGPSKSMIKKSPKFDKLRRNNSEWAGCTQMASAIRGSIFALNRLEDYAVTGALNALTKQIQHGDLEGEHGQRRLLLSLHKEMLAGFNVSKKQALETVLRVPMEYNIDRENVSAKVLIPTINTNLHLVNFRNLPFFRIVMVLGSVSDMEYVEANKQYQAMNPIFLRGGKTIDSEWFSAHSIIPDQVLEVQFPLDKRKLTDDVTLVLGVGVEFGNSGFDGKPVGVKYVGCGKVVKVG